MENTGNVENDVARHIPPEVPKSMKIFSPRQVVLGAFLGGPLAGAYLLSSNFRSQGRTKWARDTWMYSLILVAMIISVEVYVPSLHIVVISLPMVLVGATFYIAEKCKPRSGDPAYSEKSTWASLGVGFGGMALTFLIAFVIILIPELGSVNILPNAVKPKTDTMAASDVNHGLDEYRTEKANPDGKTRYEYMLIESITDKPTTDFVRKLEAFAQGKGIDFYITDPGQKSNIKHCFINISFGIRDGKGHIMFTIIYADKRQSTVGLNSESWTSADYDRVMQDAVYLMGRE